ncbi:MAG: pyridoxal-phosphate dependent enzyme [Planctomycetia bacterium]|nr:pyridoxal-phosphate dependent enzyme [Planctomycetia bacterium]
MNLTLTDIERARERISGRLHRTPLVPSQSCSELLGCRVSLKLECFQKTGSFKPRGAFNKLLSLSTEERARGVVAVSGGNHAQGVAYAAQQLGCRATIYMPQSTPSNYLNATRSYGAQIVLCENIHAAFEQAAQANGQLVHPFDDPFIAAGQGTIGLEIREDAPDATHVFVSIGGGGLFAGVATALNPFCEVIGVETHGADAMARSLAANALVEMPAITSIARTLGRGVTVVSDEEAVEALEFLLERAKVLTEPAASCTLAAARRERFLPTDHVVLLLCGGNAALSDLCGWRGMIQSR